MVYFVLCNDFKCSYSLPFIVVRVLLIILRHLQYSCKKVKCIYKSNQASVWFACIKMITRRIRYECCYSTEWIFKLQKPNATNMCYCRLHNVLLFSLLKFNIFVHL